MSRLSDTPCSLACLMCCTRTEHASFNMAEAIWGQNTARAVRPRFEALPLWMGDPAAFWAWSVSAAAAANWLVPASCACHCSGNQADESLLLILKSQLDRCGPEALHGLPQPSCPEPSGLPGDGLGAILAVVFIFGIFIGCLVGWFAHLIIERIHARPTRVSTASSPKVLTPQETDENAPTSGPTTPSLKYGAGARRA